LEGEKAFFWRFSIFF